MPSTSAASKTSHAQPLVFRSMTIGDLPEAINEVEAGMKTLPLLQFIMDWNHFPEDRKMMLSGSLPDDCPTDHAAAIAAVIHALCDRDGYDFPKCLNGIKAKDDITISLSPVNTPYTRKVRDRAPAICFEHRVFFDEDMLNKA